MGGAVRDKCLNLPVKERDWVVTGATPDDMLKQGFRQVGKDFPVFLHPDTHEEYALARTERKIAAGYKGFETSFDSAVSLEEDLQRRDLTINAIAETPNGAFVDPFNGLQDLKYKILRHVSPAFVEDPVRILRIARFSARFFSLGFHIAPETYLLMQQMVENGEVDALVPERIWKEVSRALTEQHPAEFFKVLNHCQALSRLFPEFIDYFENALNALNQAVQITQNPSLRWAALCHDLTFAQFTALHQRLHLPKEFIELPQLIIQYAETCRQTSTIEEKLKLLEKLDAFRRPDRFEDFLTVCQILTIDISTLKQTLQLAQQIDVQLIIRKGFQGSAIKNALFDARVAHIKSNGHIFCC
ncbi:MAG: Multifunctional protein [Pseudomonadota bacterium]